MANDMMQCSIEDPVLKIKPGSVPGKGGTVEISFRATTTNLDTLEVEYQILPTSDYVFGEPANPFALVSDSGTSVFMDYEVESAATATRGYSSGALPIVRQGGDHDEAALKVVAKVTGQLSTAKLKKPRYAIGSIAILSGGLRKLMLDHFGGQLPTDSEAFEAKAREFVRTQQEQLKNKYKGFASLDPRTVVNAVLGETGSTSATIKKLGPVIEHFKKSALEQVPAKFKGKTGNE